MKKLIISILACVCCVLFVCACTSKHEIPPEPDLTIFEEIKTEYYNANKEHFTSKYYTYTADDISIRYYGEYNGAHVMFLDVPFIDYDCAIHDCKIDGVKFTYSDGQTLDVYYQGQFYGLQSAFDSGILTHSDLVDVRNAHKNNNLYLYE